MVKKRSSKQIFGEALLTLAQTAPLERITVKQIVEKSGLSLQTFYNHFHDKEELILWLHQQGGERALRLLEGKNYSFHDLTMDNIRFYEHNANYLRSSFGTGVVNPYAEISANNAYRFFSIYICRRFDLAELPEDVSFYLRVYVSACLYIFGEWALKGWEIPAERLADYLEDGVPEKLKPYLLG
jgi:AcrR family transcriptional regulator